MDPEIRKIVTFDEEVFIEGFRKADVPWRMFAVAAVVQNPWAGRYVEDLRPEIRSFGPVLGETFFPSDFGSFRGQSTVPFRRQ